MTKLLVVTFDITGFTEKEIDRLMLEVAVQGESSDDHPEAIVRDCDTIEVSYEDV